MKQVLAVLAVVFVFAGVSEAQVVTFGASCTPGNAVAQVPFAEETVTVSSSSIGLTVATFNPASPAIGATEAFITVGSVAIRVWFTGTAPTSTVGHYYAAYAQFKVCAATLPRLRMISSAGDSATAVTYMRPAQ